MATAVLHTYVYETAKKGESFLDKILKVYRENQADILCGILALNGASNVYPLYKSLTE